MLPTLRNTTRLRPAASSSASLTAAAAAAFGARVLYEPGCEISKVDTSGFGDALAVAAVADVTIFVGGLDQSVELK